MRGIKPFVLIVVLFSLQAHAMEGMSSSMEQMRMQKRFGFGFSAAGPLSVLGLEFDFNITEQLSVGGGIGTGLDYSTFMVKGKYLLLGKWVSPYFAAGLARWWTGGTKEEKLSPSVLANKFLDGEDLRDGFSVFIFYPAVGVQFMHPIGIAVFVEAQYLFKMVSFANGTYAGLGAHWYF
ncbi:MAG: hypothetical protein HY537_09575 [Deltaproteobacteria bacterium]|nr:hypothetical protein [Deltaproteobacteria bacterium]